MIYQKSYVPPGTVGVKGGNPLDSVFHIGIKAAGHVVRLGEKTKRFYEKYGGHLPAPVAEKARELEPYFNKGMDVAKKARNTLEKAKRSKENKMEMGFSHAMSAGIGSRPAVNRRALTAQHTKRVNRRSSQDVSH